jgi:XapX domain-containing protein
MTTIHEVPKQEVPKMSYLISLGAGFVVGLLYWLVRVQSPAPPLIALAGLLGIVLGEHAIPVIRGQLFPSAQEVQIQPTQSQTNTAVPATKASRDSK